MGVAIEEYNHCIERLRARLAEPETLLKALAEQTESLGEGVVERSMQQISEKAAALKPISLNPSDGILTNLVVPNRNVVLVKSGRD